MKKETEIAFEYGREAVKAGLDFIPSQDSNMYNLICESHIVPDHDRSMENTSAWYEGYLMQTAAEGQGISKELFAQAVSVFIGCRTEAIPIWVDFAAENVEHDHYVDFVQKYDESMEINRWLETLLAGLLRIKVQFGEPTASEVCNLSLKQACLYPHEMELAAKYIQSGGDLEKINDLIDSGEFEDDAISFPKLYMEDGTDHLKTSIDWRIQEM